MTETLMRLICFWEKATKLRSLCASESVEQERRQTERGLELGSQNDVEG